MPEIKGRRYVLIIKRDRDGAWWKQDGQTGDERSTWTALSWDELKRLTARPKGRTVSDADNFDARRYGMYYIIKADNNGTPYTVELESDDELLDHLTGTLRNTDHKVIAVINIPDDRK